MTTLMHQRHDFNLRAISAKQYRIRKAWEHAPPNAFRNDWMSRGHFTNSLNCVLNVFGKLMTETGGAFIVK